MKNIIAAASIVLASAGGLGAQTAPKPDARIEYLGGLTVCAGDPRALAKWYTDKLGVPVDQEYNGMFYGTLKFGAVELNIGIHPVSADCQKTPRGFALTFHVDDYAGYLAKLARVGLAPFKTEKTPYGTFAYFLDPENHEVAIWGK